MSQNNRYYHSVIGTVIGTVILTRIPIWHVKNEKVKWNWHIMVHYIQAGILLWRSVWKGRVSWWRWGTYLHLFTPSVLIYSHMKCLQILDVISLSPITQRCFQVVFSTFLWHKIQRYLINWGWFSKDLWSAS